MATLKNTTIDDTGFLNLPAGNTAQRPSNPIAGVSRYNTETGVIEFYTTQGWITLSSLLITGISPSVYNGDANSSFTLSGTGFYSGCTVTILTKHNAASYTAATVTVNSSTSITFTTPQAFTSSDSPLSIRVTTPLGFSYTATNILNASQAPVWNTSAGTIANIYDSARNSYPAITLSATDPEGSAVTYSLVSGSLPTNMSLGSNGIITRTDTIPSVANNTTYTFTVRASDSLGTSSDRQFSIIVYAPVVTSYTSTGSATWSVPLGVSSVRVVVVAGGGGGGTRDVGVNAAGSDGGAGGGAGGMIDHPSFPVTPEGTVPLSVGAGGSGGSSGISPGTKGQNSNFGGPTGLTAIGGGFGGAGPLTPAGNGGPGGSGGGKGGGGGSGDANGAGSGVQSAQPGDSGTYGYGFPGGNTPASGAPYRGGGGGGAGAAGAVGNAGGPGIGGVGRSTDISGSPTFYAGGGGGGGSINDAGGAGGSGGGGQGGGTGSTGSPASNGSNGSTNTGGGGGGGAGYNAAGGGPDGGAGGSGGPGIILIKY
jgi:hypothetical protein